jgi:hypothetical protein
MAEALEFMIMPSDQHLGVELHWPLRAQELRCPKKRQLSAWLQRWVWLIRLTDRCPICLYSASCRAWGAIELHAVFREESRT